MTQRKILLTVLLSLFAVLIAYRGYEFYSTFRAQSQLPDTKGLSRPIKKGISNERFVSPILSVPPNKMLEYIQSAYRLQADVRMTNAIAEIHYFLTGEPKEKVKADFQNGKWALYYKTEPVGELPELPDFPDWMKLLEDWTIRTKTKSSISVTGNKTFPELEQKINDLNAASLLESLEKLNTLWNQGSRTPEILRLASRSLTLLTFLNLDELEITTSLMSRTMAMLVLTETLTDANVRAEECLFAQETGYSKYALQCGESLPKSEFVRQYVTLDDENLKTLAAKSKFAEAFWIARLSKDKDLKTWQEWVSSARPASSSTQIAKASVQIEHEYKEPFVPLSLTVYAEVAKNPAKLDEMKLSKLMQDFESALAKRTNIQGGPFIDSDLEALYYRSFFYSGLFLQAKHYLSHRYEHDIGRIESFIHDLNPDAGQVAKEFYHWITHLVDFKKNGSSNLPTIVDDLTAFPHLGAAPLQVTYDELAYLFQYSNIRLFQPAVQLVKRMDTRPSHRYYLGVVAQRNLNDPKLADRLYNSFASIVSPCEYTTLTEYANLAADENFIKQLLHTPKCGVECRVGIFWRLIHQRPIDHQFVSVEFEKFIQEFPKSWRARDFYVDYLRDKHDFDQAIRMIESWLAKNSQADFFDDGVFHAHLRLSYTNYLAGHYDDAWKTLQPIAMMDRADVNSTKALILARLGQAAESEKILREVVAEFPTYPDYRLDLTDALWINGKYAEAAIVLKEAPQTDNDRWCKQVANRFLNIFWKEPPEKESLAIKALLDAKLNLGPPGCMPLEMAMEGNYQHALQWYSQLEKLSLIRPQDDLTAYYSKRMLNGKSAAMDWLKKKYAPEKRSAFIQASFQYQDADLLWDFLPDPDNSEAGTWMWLNRAIATFKTEPVDQTQKNKLEQHFKNSTSHYPELLGSFLLGHMDQEKLLTYATTPGRRGEIAYMIGLKEQIDGHYADAADWYRVSLETFETGNRYVQLAGGTLADWNQQNISFSRIVKAKQAVQMVHASKN